MKYKKRKENKRNTKFIAIINLNNERMNTKINIYMFKL